MDQVLDLALSRPVFGQPFFSSTLVGVKPIPVEIEIDLSPGLPFFQIVGLPDTVLRESKTRVKSAILQAGYEFPYDQRVVLNLAPSKVPKEGSGFELALAARILASSGQIPFPEMPVMFLGELALDGTVRAIPEIEALSLAARGAAVNAKMIVVPRECAESVRRLVDCPVVGINHLQDFSGSIWWEATSFASPLPLPQVKFSAKQDDFRRLRFSEFWARHLQIAAVGGHHYLLCGPPGCGKSFFAESLRCLMGSRASADDIEAQVLDALFKRESHELPWAAPHHSVTTVGLLGGGNNPQPGALTRAHGGILFLDELLEFSGAVLDSLREPIEKGRVEIFRAGRWVTFPGKVQMIAATNPCRCGNYKHPWIRCICMPHQRNLYQQRLSGPFFDRFDIRIFSKPSMNRELEISGEAVLSGVRRALVRKNNGQPLRWEPLARKYFEVELPAMRLNRRACMSVEKIVETLAIVDDTSTITLAHVKEAQGYQKLEELEAGPRLSALQQRRPEN